MCLLLLVLLSPAKILIWKDSRHDQSYELSLVPLTVTRGMKWAYNRVSLSNYFLEHSWNTIVRCGPCYLSLSEKTMPVYRKAGPPHVEQCISKKLGIKLRQITFTYNRAGVSSGIYNIFSSTVETISIIFIITL